MLGKVLLIRHAEKSDDLGDEKLSLKGRERAGALAPYFYYTYSSISAIYAAGIGKHSPSHRPRSTVKPTAKKFKLSINDKHLKDDYAAMVDDVKSKAIKCSTFDVLICWEHTLLHNIAVLLGADAADVPANWHGDRYDIIYLLDFDASGKCTFAQIPQKLLYGDQDSTLPLEQVYVK